MTLAENSAVSQVHDCAAVAERVFIYGMNYAPEPTGVGRYTGDIGSYLIQHGVDVEIVTAVPHYPGWAVRGSYRNRYKVERVDGARITRCPLLLKSDMRGLWRVLAPLSFAATSAPAAIWRILTTRPNTVLCIEPTLFAAPAALLAAKIVGARTVLHVQDLEVDAAFAVGHLSSRGLQVLAGWFERKVLSKFDTVVTISSRMRERLETKGVAPTRLRVIRNWVDLDKIRPLDGPVRLKQELGIVEEAFVVLYAGNIGPKQALSLMLDSAAKLVSHAHIQFILAGDGPEKHTLVEKYGNLPNVRFLPLQPESRLCELLNLADVHLLPQHGDAADMVLPSKLGGMLSSGKHCLVMADPGTELHTLLDGIASITPAGDRLALEKELRSIAMDRRQPNVKMQRELAKQFDRETNLARLRDLVAKRF